MVKRSSLRAEAEVTRAEVIDYARKAREVPNARKIAQAETLDYARKAREASNARKIVRA